MWTTCLGITVVFFFSLGRKKYTTNIKMVYFPKTAKKLWDKYKVEKFYLIFNVFRSVYFNLYIFSIQIFATV